MALDVKALVFDVFGTVVDWRTSVAKHAAAFGKANGTSADWEAFADGWRGKYQPYMGKVRSGELPWTKLDALHRMGLEELLGELGITGVSEEAKADLNLAWHRLDPWPDSPPGLERLKAKFIIGTMSNGNVALMTNMAKYAGLPWDCILGGGTGPSLQARRQDLPYRRGAVGVGTAAGDDGGGPPERPAGGSRRGPEDRLRAPAHGVWPRSRPGHDSRPVLRLRSRRLPRPGVATRRLAALLCQ